eukprot:TRINITY_DN65203_c0_g2_i1.p1 TRINITY_DN65203_c0_g2~~TRINITY_DN65203_c0_g2_i1.p1  ORF type:complete len:562 (+),score=214.42 TRINITY_DN65203_c0_g2_i1:96-1688(+)
MIVLGIVIQFVIEQIVISQAEDMLPMKDYDSALFQPWLDHGGAGSPIYNHFFVWNITNAEEYVYDGERPILEKIGPFVYRNFQWRDAVQWSGNNREFINFTYHSYNVKAPERTTKQWAMTEKVTIPNYPLQGLFLAVETAFPPEEYPALFNDIMDAVKLLTGLDNDGLFLTMTIEEALFGYNDKTIDLVVNRVLEIVKFVDPKFSLSHISGFNQLQSIDTPQFYANKSVQYSGTSNYKKTAEFIEWCGLKDLSQYWPEDPKIEGTDGWNFPPQPDDVLKLFIDSIPAVVTVNKREKVDVKGIHTNRFYISDDIFRNDSAFAKTHYTNCPSGMINLTSVQGASVFLSNPHFQNGDPVLREWVDIPPPDAERDTTWLAIEPITGSSVKAQQLIQINLRMTPSMCALTGRYAPEKNCSMYEAYFPMVIVNNYADIPDNEADLLKSQIYGTPDMAKLIGWIMVGLSVGIFLWVFLLLRHVKAVEGSYFGFTAREVALVNEERQSLLDDDDDERSDVSESRISRISHVSAARRVR